MPFFHVSGLRSHTRIYYNIMYYNITLCQPYLYLHIWGEIFENFLIKNDNSFSFYLRETLAKCNNVMFGDSFKIFKPQRSKNKESLC